MAQAGIPYILTGPDGARAVFNDTSDPDFVGYLDPENGVTGLLDSADVRESFSNLTEEDGSIQGDSFLSRKTGTLQGILYPDVPANTTVRESKLKRASRGLRAGFPSVLTWTPDGSPQRRIDCYRQGRVAILGRRPKTFVVPLSTPMVYQASAALNQLVLTATAGGSQGEVGFTNPITNPIIDTYNQGSQLFITNQGDAPTWPKFSLVGPVTNPTLRNNTTGLQWTLTATLSSTDILVVDSAPPRTVIFNGVNKYSAYAANFSINSWWALVSGANDVRLLASSFSTGAAATVTWRDAWE
jgi:hypothetical protein